MAWMGAVKVAVTLRAWLIGTWQTFAPPHAPDQPLNVCPVDATAVRVTVVVVVKEAVQVPLSLPELIEQLIPLGLEATVPLPVPFPDTVS